MFVLSVNIEIVKVYDQGWIYGGCAGGTSLPPNILPFVGKQYSIFKPICNTAS